MSRRKPAAPAAAAPAQPDSVGEKLIKAGLIGNRHLLDINGTLAVPHTMELPAPWNLPSRLFRFPIEISEGRDQERHIGLMHPLLADHPFVQQVEAALGVQLDPCGAPNDSGYSKADTAKWWHAVDLISSGHWRELLETAAFTTLSDIAGAVAYGLSYSHHHGEKKGCSYITTAEAREIMRAIDSPEPTERVAMLRGFSSPTALKHEGEKAATWPINDHGPLEQDARAWGRIAGIEAGWFAYDRAGFLGWTEAGRDRYAAGESIAYTEANGQSAFAF